MQENGHYAGQTASRTPRHLSAVIVSVVAETFTVKPAILADQFRRQILRYTLGYIREIGIILNPEVNNAALCVGKTNTILGDFFEIRLRI